MSFIEIPASPATRALVPHEMEVISSHKSKRRRYPPTPFLKRSAHNAPTPAPLATGTIRQQPNGARVSHVLTICRFCLRALLLAGRFPWFAFLIFLPGLAMIGVFLLYVRYQKCVLSQSGQARDPTLANMLAPCAVISAKTPVGLVGPWRTL